MEQFLWHGNVYRALDVIEDLECRPESIVSSFRRVLLVTEMMSHLSVQDPFNQGLGELLEETAADRAGLRASGSLSEVHRGFL